MQNTKLCNSLHINSKQKDSQLLDDFDSISTCYKQKKQSAKILQNKNKTGSKCNNVLEDLKQKRRSFKEENSPKKLNDVSKPTESRKCSDNHIENGEVNKLLSNATSSIIEKTCLEDCNTTKGKLQEPPSDSWKENGLGNRKYNQYHKPLKNCIT